MPGIDDLWLAGQLGGICVGRWNWLLANVGTCLAGLCIRSALSLVVSGGSVNCPRGLSSKSLGVFGQNGLEVLA